MPVTTRCSSKHLLRNEVKLRARLMGTPQNRSVPKQGGCRVCETYKSKKSGVKSLVLRLPLDSFKKQDADKASQSADLFFTNVNAILNSSSHKCLCIHAEDLHFFDIFCQIVDDRLVSLIPDDTLFHYNFHSWFHDPQHLVFRFKDRSRDRGWSTFDFNTTVSLNKGKERRLAHFQFRKFMQDLQSPCARRSPVPRNKDPSFSLDREVTFFRLIPFQECAYHQAKDRRYFRFGLRGDTIAYLFWQDCEIGSYVSALSKVHGGGSVYFGIEEIPLEGGAKKFYCRGITLTSTEFEDLKTEFNKELKNRMAWFGFKPKESISTESIVPAEILFRRIVDNNVFVPNLFVVEVKVNFFPGICFNDANGPASFTFEGNKPINEPIPVIESKWIEQNKYTDLKRYTAEIDGREVKIRCADGAGAEGVE